jgi:hypothetical protein
VIMLKQYNSIVNDCLAALKGCDLPEIEKLQIEVRLYTLKRRLLDVDPLTWKPEYGGGVTEFEDLKARIDRCRGGCRGNGGPGTQEVISKLEDLILKLVPA